MDFKIKFNFQIVLFACCCCYLAKAEFFTSVVGLEELLKTEEILVADLKNYVAEKNLENSLLEKEISKVLHEHESARKDAEDYLTNPINVFRLVKRLYTDWWKFSEHATNSSDVVELLSAKRKDLAFPSYTDLEESAVALMRLQQTYSLNVTQLASGIINGKKYGPTMSWTDCLVLAQQLLNVGAFDQAKSWIEQFSKHFDSSEEKPLSIKQHIKENLMDIGNKILTVKIFQSVLDGDNKHFEMLKGFYKTPYLTSEAYVEELSYHSTNEFKDYEKVCRGEMSREPGEERDLRCRYHFGQSDFCRLAPFKMEEINLDPFVVVYHDMITDKQIQLIKDYSLPYMRRSTVRDDFDGKSQRNNYRISKNAWLPYDWHWSILKLLRDLDYATGLDMRDSEEMQVANYGFGGHYEPHVDFYLSVDDEVQNNRISTSIFYLSDVEQGGATAFPYLKVAVKPSKGDVLFWYNLHRSLEGDYRTKHAGCPVLKGSKWIGNVWTPDRYQFARRPCLVYRDSESSVPYQSIY